MRYLSLLSSLACAALLACGQEQAPTASGPAGKASASADCSLAEIFSGKEGCREDPSLDEVPAGYIPPVDTTATAPADTLATAPADTLATAPAETPSETPSAAPEPVVPEPVIIHVPGEEEPETALHEAATLTPEQARAQLESKGIAFTGAAFRLAAQSGNLEVVQLFVQAGMSLEEADDYDWTALSEAAYAGRLETVKYLVGQGANIEARDEDGWTVLMNAAGIANNLSVVRFLVESGADVLAVGDDQRTTAWSVAMTVGNTAIADYLKSLTNAGDSVPLSPEEAAAELSRRGIAYTDSAFVASAGQGNLGVVKLFVWAGMSVDGKTTGSTALHVAAAAGHLEMVRYLVGAGAAVNATDSGGYTALHLAVSLEVVKVLVGAGAAVNATDRLGYTALHTAAFYGLLEVVKVLVGAGADVNATTRHGNTARDRAADRGHTDVVEYFDSLADDADG